VTPNEEGTALRAEAPGRESTRRSAPEGSRSQRARHEDLCYSLPPKYVDIALRSGASKGDSVADVAKSDGTSRLNRRELVSGHRKHGDRPTRIRSSTAPVARRPLGRTRRFMGHMMPTSAEARWPSHPFSGAGTAERPPWPAERVGPATYVKQP
jgi:hypothetical protein